MPLINFVTFCSISYSSHVVLTLSPSEVDPAKQRDRFQLAKWVPRGDHALVVVYMNDIYFITDVERPESFVRVTSNGKSGVVFNGIPDWLYEGKSCLVVSLVLSLLPDLCKDPLSTPTSNIPILFFRISSNPLIFHSFEKDLVRSRSFCQSFINRSDTVPTLGSGSNVIGYNFFPRYGVFWPGPKCVFC